MTELSDSDSKADSKADFKRKPSDDFAKIERTEFLEPCLDNKKKKKKWEETKMFLDNHKVIFFWSRSPCNFQRYLSNFQPLQTPLEYKGQKYPTVEHAFQAAKYNFASFKKNKQGRLFGGPAEMRALRNRFAIGGEFATLEAAKIKSKGMRKHFKDLQIELNLEKWDENKDGVMMKLLHARMNVDPLFKKILTLSRGIQLLHFERAKKGRSYWGVPTTKMDADGKIVTEPNTLGKMMMRLASYIEIYSVNARR